MAFPKPCMKVQVILHSYLREKLPAEAKGRAVLELPEGSNIQDVISQLDLPGEVLCAVNGQIEHNLNFQPKEGDELRFLRPAAGG